MTCDLVGTRAPTIGLVGSPSTELTLVGDRSTLTLVGDRTQTIPFQGAIDDC